MSIFFAFSDECGQYRTERSEGFLKGSPFYVRSALLINAENWKKLNEDFLILKEKYGLRKTDEIKWSYVWSLHKYLKDRKPIPEDKEFKRFESLGPEKLINFIADSLKLLLPINAKIVLTITDNRLCPRYTEVNLLKMHLQNVMQRLEMEMQLNDDLCVIFFDNCGGNDHLLRIGYNKLYLEGDRFVEFSHLKDSLNVELSHHSAGIQIADYVTGVVVSALRKFEKSKNLFEEHIKPLLRKGSNGKIGGYGVIEIPRDDVNRYLILTQLGLR